MSMKKFMTLALATSFALSFSALKAEEAQRIEENPMEATMKNLEKELEQASLVDGVTTSPVAGEGMEAAKEKEEKDTAAKPEEAAMPVEGASTASAEAAGTNHEG